MFALAHDCAQGLDNVVDIGGSFPAGGDTRRAWWAPEAWCDGAAHAHQCVPCPECYLCARPL